MNGEVLETTKPKDWNTKVKKAAPVATSLLVISVTYLFVAVTQEEADFGLFVVGVFAGAALVFLPAILYVAGRIRATDFRVLKSWILLFPVTGWLIGKFLLVPWIKAIF